MQFYYCLHLQDPSGEVAERLVNVRRAIVGEINAHVCLDCDLTEANIRDDEFSCRGGLTSSIVYRAMIVGTDSYSAPSIVSFIQSWVASGTASITSFSSRLHLDKFCNTILDTFNEPDCPEQVWNNAPLNATTIAGLSTIAITTPKPEDKVPSNINAYQVRGGEIGGFVIGSIIAMLLLMLILIIVFLAVRKRFSYKFHRR